MVDPNVPMDFGGVPIATNVSGGPSRSVLVLLEYTWPRRGYIAFDSSLPRERGRFVIDRFTCFTIEKVREVEYTRIKLDGSRKHAWEMDWRGMSAGHVV